MVIGLLSKKNKEINKVVLLPLAEIYPNPHQPRKHFDAEAIQDLSRSIVANGLLQPITVRKTESGYELIAGERRAMAFRTLGREHIPGIVEEYSEEQSAVLALIENLQRKDLNFFEEAVGIAKLMESLQLNQQQIGTRLGKAQSTIANKLRLLRFSPELQRWMLESGLTERHARTLLRIPEMSQLEETISLVIAKNWNVHETEEYVDKLLEKREKKKAHRLFVIKDMRIFQNSIQKACHLMKQAGIPIQNEMSETEEAIEYRIVIPRSLVYKDKSKGHPGKRSAI